MQPSNNSSYSYRRKPIFVDLVYHQQHPLNCANNTNAFAIPIWLSASEFDFICCLSILLAATVQLLSTLSVAHRQFDLLAQIALHYIIALSSTVCAWACVGVNVGIGDLLDKLPAIYLGS